MTEPLADTWHSRDLPVLRTIVRLHDAEAVGTVRVNVLEAELADTHTPDDIQRAGVALAEAGLIEMRGASGLLLLHVPRVSAEARRLAGSWPTEQTALDRMIAALEAIAENTDDEDTRSRARKLLDGLTGAGRQIGLSVAAAAITGQIPGAS